MQTIISVPFLSDSDIERAATNLLVQFRDRNGGRIRPPAPVEEILEKQLKLSLGFDDLHQRLGIPRRGEEPDVLGALWAERREVLIDESLDPEEHPEREGRYLFTLAHEIGHWCLHKDYLALPVQQVDAFGKDRPPTVICRSQANDRIEQQANSFAACLLMPERWVRIVWRDLYSRSNAMAFSDWQNSHSDWTRPPLGWRGPIDTLVADRFGSKAVEYFCYRASAPMAEHFGVSSQAMRVRLEKLGLLIVDRHRRA